MPLLYTTASLFHSYRGNFLYFLNICNDNKQIKKSIVEINLPVAHKKRSPFPFISDCSRFPSWWRSSSPFAISISFVIEAYFFSQSSLETIPLTLGSTILSFCFSRFEILASRSVIFFAGEPERIVFLTVSLQSTPKTQKTRKRQISINAHEYGLFHLFFPSCIHAINLSPFRYEVGWVFIFEVDLFYHMSKALFFYRFTATKPFLQ